MILSWWLEQEAIRAQVELYAEVARAHGHDPDRADHVISCVCSIADSQTEARDAIRDTFWWWRKVGLDALFKFEELRKLPNYRGLLRRWEESALQSGDDDRAQRAALERIIELNVIGTPEQCADRISELAQVTGVRHFVCGFEALSDQARIHANIQRFVTDVVPKIAV
jgi:alkanesulfonate monooxygenase SsuD/methylene tetrahydromethanopterin reductase-like flavin-dependent oxidoreductase (luciferase family)